MGTPTMGKNKNAGKPRNYALECGVYRFGKGKMYHKKAIYKFNKKAASVKAATPKPTFVEKPVKGAKNGETRMVRVKRLRNDVPTVDKKPAGTSVNFFSKHKRSLRATLTPGKICILLAGAHKGKRVVVLKQLASGLVLITGPMKLNGCVESTRSTCWLPQPPLMSVPSRYQRPSTMSTSSTPRLKRSKRPKVIS